MKANASEQLNKGMSPSYIIVALSSKKSGSTPVVLPNLFYICLKPVRSLQSHHFAQYMTRLSHNTPLQGHCYVFLSYHCALCLSRQRFVFKVKSLSGSVEAGSNLLLKKYRKRLHCYVKIIFYFLRDLYPFRTIGSPCIM